MPKAPPCSTGGNRVCGVQGKRCGSRGGGSECGTQSLCPRGARQGAPCPHGAGQTLLWLLSTGQGRAPSCHGGHRHELPRRAARCALSTGHAGGWWAGDCDQRQQEAHWFADRMWLLTPEGMGGMGDKVSSSGRRILTQLLSKDEWKSTLLLHNNLISSQ